MAGKSRDVFVFMPREEVLPLASVLRVSMARDAVGPTMHKEILPTRNHLGQI